MRFLRVYPLSLAELMELVTLALPRWRVLGEAGAGWGLHKG